MLFDRDTGSPGSQRQGRAPALAGPPPDAVQDQIERTLSSEAFVHSPQLCRFLRFIVEQEIGGHGEELKEYSLGIQVFRKDESFDPRIDTVVRTEARRLRHKLAEYYQGEGRSDPIEILLPKGGYRATFHARAEAASLAPAASAPIRTRKIWWAAGALCALAAAAVYWVPARANRRDAGPVRPPSIAVLPLENLSADPEQEYFSDGMTEALITDLAKIRGLRVISRTSVLQFKKTKTPMPEIARQLGVEYLVEGTVVRAGDRVRITAQLITIPNERHLWAESYERAGSDLLTLQADIARAIAGQVNIHLTPRERAALASPTVSPEAHDAYLKGRFHWQARKTDSVRKSVEYFKVAIEKEPRYALAYAGLSDAYTVLALRSDGRPRKDLRKRAYDAAMKAIKLDDNLGEAHAALAVSADEWGWKEAERQFRRAIELSPGYATAHERYAWLLGDTGRFDEALSEIQLALELDPLSPGISGSEGWLLYYARRYDHAIRQFRHTVELFPDLARPHAGLGMAYDAKGMHREAADALERALKLTGNDPYMATLLAHARAGKGDTKELHRLLGEFKNRKDVSPLSYALLYLDLGDRDRAFVWLDTGIEQRSRFMSDLKMMPVFDRLHGDPRFTALLQKMNLAN